MDIEKLIEDLRGLLKQYGEKIPYGELVGAPWPYSKAGDLVWPDPEPYFIEQAATALSTLQAENEKLREKIEDARLEGYAKGLGEMSEENEKLRAELEKVKRERDAAVEQLHGICESCVHYTPYHNRGKCASCEHEIVRDKKITPSDNWEWRGQKED